MGTYTSFISENIAPYAAHHIGVYDSQGTKIGRIKIDNFKPEYGERLLRFGALSDVHNSGSLGSNYEVSEDFQNALAWLNQKESIAFTCITGDLTYNGNQTAEYELFCTNRDALSGGTPVYACTGNHDASSGLNETMWKQYIGSDPTYYFYNEQANAYFVFFSMNKWSLGSSGTPYKEEDIALLNKWIPKMTKFSKVFIFTHLFFPDRAGNFKHIYPSGNWLGGSQLTAIEAIADANPNCVWLSGHSHWKWHLQQYETTANIAHNSANNSYALHLPSCGYPIDSDGVSTRTSKPGESEGAVIDVYKDYVDVRAMVFKDTGDSTWTNNYIPIGQYRLNMPTPETLKNVNILTWQEGGIDSTTGQEATASSTFRTSYIDINNIYGYYLSARNMTNLIFYAYDANHNFLGQCKKFLAENNDPEFYNDELINKDITMSLRYSYDNTAYVRGVTISTDTLAELSKDIRITTTKLYENYLQSQYFFEGSTARTGQFVIQNLEDGYILVTAPTLEKLGNFVRTASWYSGCTHATLKVEDVIWIQEPTNPEAKSKLGFCETNSGTSTNYTLSSTDNLRFAYPTSGAEFNIATAYLNIGEAPVSFKMKAILYYLPESESEIILGAEYVRAENTYVDSNKTSDTPSESIQESIDSQNNVTLSFQFSASTNSQGYILCRGDSTITANTSKVYWTYDSLVITNKDGTDITNSVLSTSKLGFYYYNGTNQYSFSNYGYTTYKSNRNSVSKYGIQFNISSSYYNADDGNYAIDTYGPFTITFTNLKLYTTDPGSQEPSVEPSSEPSVEPTTYVTDDMIEVNTGKKNAASTLNASYTTSGSNHILSFQFPAVSGAQGIVINNGSSLSAPVSWAYDQVKIYNKNNVDITTNVSNTGYFGFYTPQYVLSTTGTISSSSPLTNKTASGLTGIQFNISSSYPTTTNADYSPITTYGPFTVEFTNLRIS